VAYGIVLEFEGIGKKEYDSVNDELGIDTAAGTGDWPAGIISHMGGATPTGLVVVEVWESKAQQEAWMGGTLGAALVAKKIPAPVRVTELEITGYATP
jgi:hypothetical protein